MLALCTHRRTLPSLSVLLGYIHYLRVWKAIQVECYMAESEGQKASETVALLSVVLLS